MKTSFVQRIDQITSTKNPPSQKWNFHTTPEPLSVNHHHAFHSNNTKLKIKIEELENKARTEFAQLKSQSATKQSSETAAETADEAQYGDYNDVDLDEIVEINRKNECGINFLTKKSEGTCSMILTKLFIGRPLNSDKGIALASFPGSGVTWLRHLIHQR